MKSAKEKAAEVCRKFEWREADKSIIGKNAVFLGVFQKVIKISRISECKKYYYDSNGEIYPSFLIEVLGEPGTKHREIGYVQGKGTRLYFFGRAFEVRRKLDQKRNIYEVLAYQGYDEDKAISAFKSCEIFFSAAHAACMNAKVE